MQQYEYELTGGDLQFSNHESHTGPDCASMENAAAPVHVFTDNKLISLNIVMKNPFAWPNIRPLSKNSVPLTVGLRLFKSITYLNYLTTHLQMERLYSVYLDWKFFFRK
jgi:hypothetical protein